MKLRMLRRHVAQLPRVNAGRKVVAGPVGDKASHNSMGNGVLAMGRSSPNEAGLKDFSMAVT